MAFGREALQYFGREDRAARAAGLPRPTGREAGRRGRSVPGAPSLGRTQASYHSARESELWHSAPSSLVPLRADASAESSRRGGVRRSRAAPTGRRSGWVLALKDTSKLGRGCGPQS